MAGHCGVRRTWRLSDVTLTRYHRASCRKTRAQYPTDGQRVPGSSLDRPPQGTLSVHLPPFRPPSRHLLAGSRLYQGTIPLPRTPLWVATRGLIVPGPQGSLFFMSVLSLSSRCSYRCQTAKEHPVFGGSSPCARSHAMYLWASAASCLRPRSSSEIRLGQL